MRTISLLSLNTSLFDENNQKLKQFLKHETTDILCLQEVTRKVDPSTLDSFISKEAVDKATPHLPFSFFASNWALRNFRMKNFHGKDMFQYDFNGCLEYGNYVRSKFPIHYGKGLYVQGFFSYVTDWEWTESNPGSEPRIVQVADLTLPQDNHLRVINYHGIWSKHKHDTPRTIRACEQIVNISKEVRFPVIICGDFNLFPDTKSINILNKQFVSLVDKYKVTHTRPKTNELSSQKRNVVDYIFVSKDITISDFKVVESDVSDHYPLQLKFII